MKKIEKEDWFILGMRILNNGDFSGITIQNLCEKLNVTKGSFYHHFGNIDGYVRALMDYWLKIYTDDFISAAERIPNLMQRKAILQQRALRAKHRNEQTIRAWGFYNPIVKGYVQEVDKIRLGYLTNLRMQMGEDALEAKRASMLELAMLVGLQSLYPGLSKEEIGKMFEERVTTPANIRLRMRN